MLIILFIFMGETAARLRRSSGTTKRTHGIYVLGEFDVTLGAEAHGL